jgi:hypothetical protein
MFPKIIPKTLPSTTTQGNAPRKRPINHH